MHKLILLLLVSGLVRPPLSFAQDKKEDKRVPAKVAPKAQKPQEIDDVEDMSDEETTPPPNEEIPNNETPEGEDPEKDDEASSPPPEPSLPELEYAQPPAEDDLQYGEEYITQEEELRKKEEEEKKKSLLVKPKPPVNEPMPLIRREREMIELSEQGPETKIRHPYAGKGLIKITRDKTYIYKVPKSDQTKAGSIRFGLFTPKELKNPDTGLFFTDFYDSDNPAMLFDYEWQISQKFGKLGFKIGTGLAMAQGSGQFETDANDSLDPKEKFTFIVLPGTVGLIYRMQYWDRQLFIPYVDGGGAVFAFSELRDDGQRPKFGGAIGVYAAAGLGIDLNRFDTISMLELDREYSINGVYFTAEYRYIVGLGRFDFTSDIINAGLTVEF